MAKIIPQGGLGKCLVPSTYQIDEERGLMGGGWLFNRHIPQMLEIPLLQFRMRDYFAHAATSAFINRGALWTY